LVESDIAPLKCDKIHKQFEEHLKGSEEVQKAIVKKAEGKVKEFGKKLKEAEKKVKEAKKGDPFKSDQKDPKKDLEPKASK